MSSESLPRRSEILNVMAAAFENRIGTTHGVGDGLRAALDALDQAGYTISRDPGHPSRVGSTDPMPSKEGR